MLHKRASIPKAQHCKRHAHGCNVRLAGRRPHAAVEPDAERIYEVCVNRGPQCRSLVRAC
eukprot:scaffold56111_cov27-Tisochrysis_lutea.AAC.5